MADMNSALDLLHNEFPDAEISCRNSIPLAKAETQLYGILFSEMGEKHAGDPVYARGPIAIVNFPTGVKDSRNYVIHKWLLDEQ